MNDLLDVFNASYERTVGTGGYNPDFIGRFYEIFLASSEDIALRFRNTNMSAQKTMLHDSLLYMVEFSTSRQIGVHLEHIARVHSRAQRDIPQRMYEAWEEALLAAVRELDPKFTEEVELAWRVVLAPGISFMKFMYNKSGVGTPTPRASAPA